MTTHQRRKNIFRKMLRPFIALVMMLSITPMYAYLWDGTLSEQPSGAGTETDPYIISLPEHLKWIFDTPSEWHAYFLQTADIDMGGLSMRTGTMTYSGIGYDETHAFTGSYDGQGFTIRNYMLEIRTPNASDNATFGLFGYAHGATLRNIHLDGAEIRFSENLTVQKVVDMRIGLLVGSISPTTKVENISITNSRITDSSNGSTLTTAFIGGVIGNEASALAGYESTWNKEMSVKNIYAEVDIDMLRTIRPADIDDESKKTQFNVGGILGRARRVAYSHLPDNTFYAGTIKAPLATISPVWGLSRMNGDRVTRAGLSTAYTGEYNTSTGSTTGSYIGKAGDTAATAVSHATASASRFYSGVSLYNPLTGNVEAIGATSANLVEGLGGTRTFVDNSNLTDNFDWLSAEDMAHWQGVTHATEIDINETNARTALCNTFNDYATSTTGLQNWVVGPDGIRLSRVPSIVIDKFSPIQYNATLTDLTPGNTYKVEWAVAGTTVGYSDVTDDSSTYTFATIPGEQEVKAYLCDNAGNRIAYPNYPTVFIFDTAENEIDLRLILESIGTGSDTYYRGSLIKSNGRIVMGGGDHGAGSVNVTNSGYAWFWERSLDPTNPLSWENAGLHSWRDNEFNNLNINWIAPSGNYYYRLSWCQLLCDASGNYIWQTDDADNLILTDDGHKLYAYNVINEMVIGPKNIIYVFDKFKWQWGFDNDLTTFDAIDRSDPSNPREYPDGNDANMGYDPYHAVKTIKRAYELIDRTRSASDNLIVIMGYYTDLKGRDPIVSWAMGNERFFSGQATITGNYGTQIYDGTLNMSVYSDDESLSLGGSTIFTDITFNGWRNTWDAETGNITHTSSELTLYANRHDVTFDRGVKMRGYNNMPSSGAETFGLIDNSLAPKITIVGGSHNQKVSAVTYPDDNAIPGVTTMTFNSGNFGRVIGGGRNNGATVKQPSYNVLGSPVTPHRVRINVAISHSQTKTGRYVPKDYAPLNNYDYDIGLLVGGQTDGTVYIENNLYMNDGYVGRFISGNISWGRGTAANYPSDSFFGSTTLTIENGEITELYGGSLGRFCATESQNPTDLCAAYFYGRSIINIKGGNIKSDIYGTSAGGVAGIGDHYYHTDDQLIPYYENGRLVYGSFEDIYGSTKTPDLTLLPGNAIPQMTLLMEENPEKQILPFDHSYSEVNISGGTIRGNVFSGGYGYSSQINFAKASNLAGNLYGNATLRILPAVGTSASPEIFGNVYGAGAGSDRYYEAAKSSMGEEAAAARFGRLGCVYGDVTMELSDGKIWGNVYGAGLGSEMFPQMATLVGNASITIDGATVMGNIFGGGAASNVDRHIGITDPTKSGNTHLVIKSGTIGNNIFGAGEGSLTNTNIRVQGNCDVEILGGRFYADPYVLKSDGTYLTEGGRKVARSFNIYGGGYYSCAVSGNTSVYAERSLLMDEGSIMPRMDNPNRPGNGKNDFHSAFNDITFRRFCIYGGGWGEKANVAGNSSVEINVLTDNGGGFINPNPDELLAPVYGQTFFDVAGGGYSGDVGYWATADGTPIDSLATPTAADYDHYVNGNASLTIKGAPFLRKAIGGGFYGTVNNANTHVVSGSIDIICGGALLGYVHNNARLRVGSHADDFAENGAQQARELNRMLFVRRSIFGGNDVKGIVGTQFWRNKYYDEGEVGVEDTDQGPLFCSDVSDKNNKGVSMFIFGGTIMGDVYGAGNGSYRGYYVPEWCRYNEGPARHYRKLISTLGGAGRVYRSRPMTGSVKIHIGGNSEDDRVMIHGNVFGGGRSCSIGQWDTLLPYEDPRRLSRGGFLHMNYGSHVTVLGSVYMGADGREFAARDTVPAGIDLSTFNGSSTQALNRLGDIAYYHWYLDTDKGYYVPGFPEPGKVDGNFGMYGAHMLRGFMKNIEMNGDVELTFYDNPYVLNAGGNIIYDISDDGEAYGRRKTWVPAELAYTAYDATDIQFTNLFGGGRCGSMSNNNLMRYDFVNHRPIPAADLAAGLVPDSENIEKFGSIYRIMLPPGVTILDKVVGGSERAVSHFYPYKNNYTAVDTDAEPTYSFDGGVTTISSFTYDLIVYNDIHNKNDHAIPPQTFMDETGGAGYSSPYTLQHGEHAGTTIYRYTYDPETYTSFHNKDDIARTRWSLATTLDKDGNRVAYVGPREERPGATTLKMTVSCQFDPQEGSYKFESEEEKHSHFSHFGGLVYGGCFESGVTLGDVIVTVGSNMLGSHLDANDTETFGSISSLAHNIGRIFGGGFGAESVIKGNTYVNLIRNVRAMNVFGGACRGNVLGQSHINYIGDENNSYIFGAIYGGCLYGSTGIPNTYDAGGNILTHGTPLATTVHLYSGNVDRVYGGGCLGNLYGRARVMLCDQVTDDLEHFDYKRLLAFSSLESWSLSRLIVGTVFGGNDISGFIYKQPYPEGDPLYNPMDRYGTYIWAYEVPNEGDPNDDSDNGKDTPGTVNGYNGFPLIGNLFGGSNGNYGIHSNEQYYSNGTVDFATGYENQVMHIELAGKPEAGYDAFEIPHVTTAHIQIDGSTILNAYGGGDQSTVTESTEIVVNYNEQNAAARAGFASAEELDRVWNTCHISIDEQKTEVMTSLPNDGGHVFDYNVYQLFGGNNKSDMAIQPTWNLIRGHLGSVYSGGNFGRMTHCVFDENTGKAVRGIRLVVDSPDFHANSLYGGGRIGNIEPTADDNGRVLDPENDITDDFYGAELEVHRGVIDHVYGGNDVSGTVLYGAKVLITGAISGDVYCAGNGNYRYLYDSSIAPGTRIQELFDEDKGGRYFVLPQKTVFGGENPSDAERILAINAYRPNIQRAYISVEGEEERPAYVRGNIYCGGNSSTIIGNLENPHGGDIRFKIGNYVSLNGVFLGSNGENLVNGDVMHNLELLNNIDLSKDIDITEADTAGYDSDPEGIINADVTDQSLYASLLDVYMRAVDVNGLPRAFDLDNDLTEAYIGDFFLGGNRGSMLCDETIRLTFPQSLVIYGKIVGGCNNANVTYKERSHIGGMIRPLSDEVDNDGKPLFTDKVDLQILSRFEPWRLTYPLDGDYRKIEREADVEVADDGNIYFPQSKCSVYGGCFTSGRTVGNIHIDLYSDLVGEYDPDLAISKALDTYGINNKPDGMSKQAVIVHGIDNLQRRTFSVIGGGYGEGTDVRGNVHIHMLPAKFHPSYWADTDVPATTAIPVAPHPSAAAVFGGSQLGNMVGNTQVHLRDGMVLANLYGASEASPLYGSTEIIVGWPSYYICNRTGRYALNRADNLSIAARENWTNQNNSHRPGILREIYLREGEYVSVNLFRQLAAEQPDIDGFDPAVDFTFVDTDLPNNFANTWSTDEITYHNITWDDILINVGNPYSRKNRSAEYLGHGNIYGGGFINTKSDVALAGKNTVCKFTAENTPDDSLIGYGGNSTILVWDNPENADLSKRIREADGSDGSVIKDHITIGTAIYKEVAVKPGMDIMGKYIWDETEQQYIHQSSHVLTPGDPMLDNKFYEIISDGGIYGGGRKVYTEGFRTCDVAYYGYADYSPQYPKLLNTCQRLDLLSFTDCCLQLQGANDFTTSSINANRFSLTRIGELQLHSSILDTEALNPGVRETTGLYNILHKTPRTRNYLAFFSDVLYVSAITSSESFDAAYRGANGQFYTAGDWTSSTGIDANNAGTVPDGADYQALPATYSYNEYKRNRINNYYANRDLPNTDGDGTEIADNKQIKALTQLEFDQRNIGTAANMIGMNNGYTLKLQGAVTDAGGKDKVYFGPINGVVEIKLLTLAMNEGGGYIFALNHHDDPNHFLQTTGNFVFPGAAYRVDGADDQKYNYIYDDCFPMGIGWDNYYGWNGSSSSMGSGKHNVRATDAGHGDCNDPDEGNEIHYWYVNGTNYYYNVTLTAYTYNGEGDFTLNNNDQLIYLYGVEGGSNFTLKDVTWSPVDTSDGYSSDIQNATSTDGAYDLDYRLFLSVDNSPAMMHDTTNPYASTAFVTSIPRSDRTVADNGTVTCTDAVASAITPVNNYSATDGSGNQNMPLLGISLFDLVNNAGKQYYQDHLAQNEHVRIVLTNESEGTGFQYVINLTIKYLLGPTITGNPVIENTALPGEYIYANSYGMNVELDDETMAVTQYNWYIVSPKENMSTNEAIRDIVQRIATGEADAECVNDCKFGNDRQLHIPAYYYRDGWNLVYEVIANNMPFYVRPDAENLANPANPDKPFVDRLLVHNYHRMRPYDGTSLTALGTPRYEDLKIVNGSRIYIEDDADMAYFFEWLADCQTAPTRHTAGGMNIDPQYADSLQIYLMADVVMPTLARSAVENLHFRGLFHGNGHTIDMGTNPMFLGSNDGKFYNTGFVSKLSGNDAIAFDTNNGRIESCFFYNSADDRKGIFINTNNGVTSNLFSTPGNNRNQTITGIACVAANDFIYGRVAYDLNHFYLDKRYNIATATADGDLQKVVNDIYADGNYRFARFDPAGVGTPTALRTQSTPNYHDYRGIRLTATYDQYAAGVITGADATFHNDRDLVDETRAIRDDDNNILYDERGQAVGYLPNYPSDHLFFGQNLAYNTSEPKRPTAFNDLNRVYRASGFYADKVDRGFHFNVAAQALHPQLTAIDFSGARDMKYNNWSAGMDSRVDREIWYAPALDLPDAAADNAGIESFAPYTAILFDNGQPQQDNDITRNLLVYNPGTWDIINNRYQYTAATSEDDIFCHPVTIAGTARPTTEFFHLVDFENFDCPIEFDVTEKAWYRRAPSLFATGNDAWEGICLPFTVHTVYAAVNSADANPIRDHGELSHFYGTHAGLDVKADSHEYWLRKFTDVTEGKAYFARPASENDLAASNPSETVRPNYHYSNTYFSNVYGTWYGDGTTHTGQTPQYTTAGIDYADYPMITSNFPYIISFPGVRFYEFDCSGQFYASMFTNPQPIPQIMTYSAEIDEASPKNPANETVAAIVKVTQDFPPIDFTHGAYTFRGTYMHHDVSAYETIIDSDAQDTNGSTLIRPSSTDERTLAPFRCYLTTGAPVGAPIKICSRGIDSIGPEGEGDENGEGNEDDQDSALEFYVDFNELVITSPYDNAFELQLYDVAGRFIRPLHIVEGENRYALPSGYYVVRDFKFRIN